MQKKQPPAPGKLPIPINFGREPGRELTFQVISGSLKGRTVSAPDLGITRPPLTRVRRSIFDFLVPYLENARYLDLFSGTGSYLFEAISRGASAAVGIERDQRLADNINQFAQRFKVADQLVCRCEDVFEALPRMQSEKKEFDLIMLAPPQYLNLVSKTLAVLRANPCSAPEALWLCQHDTSETNRLDLTGLTVLQRRKYGNTTFTIVRPE